MASNLALVGYNKRFLYCGVGAPGSTHDSRMLRNTNVYDGILVGRVIPDKGISLGEYGEFLLVTIRDTAFPSVTIRDTISVSYHQGQGGRHSWLMVIPPAR